ncbi:MAG: DASS family sodium-coupled anion symporter [Bacteroidota bacterium]|nr:DASS family sodium-coupled anion symporter [Bacteroidota bacterium]
MAAEAEQLQWGVPWGRMRWWVGMFVGLAGCAGILLLPPLGIVEEHVVALGVRAEHVSSVVLSVQRVLALLWWMLWWWVGEVVPLPVTALLPALVGPFLGLVSPRDGQVEPLPLRAFMQGYADPIVFLFLGTFVLAEGLREYGVDRRWALRLLRHPWVMRSPRRLLFAVMLGSAAVSMWMNNTATAALFMPIAVGIMLHLQPRQGRDAAELGATLVLGVAWAASIGGMMTIVGTAPNGIAVGILRQYGIEVGFLEWIRYGLPAGSILLLLAWVVLSASMHPSQGSLRNAWEYLEQDIEDAAPMGKGARRVLAVFASVVVLWLCVPLLSGWLPGLRAVDTWSIALLGAAALFLLPSGERRGSLLQWDAAQRIDWGTLLLFGGGLSLSGLLVTTGAATVLTHLLVRALSGVPPVVVLGLLLLAANLATELMSNTALAALLLPLVVPLLGALGVPVEPATVVLAMVTSCAFMLPVATPPNAIAYATQLVPLPQMVRRGIAMNIISTLVLAVLAWLL